MKTNHNGCWRRWSSNNHWGRWCGNILRWLNDLQLLWLLLVRGNLVSESISLSIENHQNEPRNNRCAELRGR